jgi:hypothetical protein
MRFMVMHKQMTEIDETAPVPPKLVKDMGALIGESLKQGIFLNGAGLKGSKYRTRLTFQGGECVAVKPGPYTGERELLAGFTMIKVKTKDEALEWARRFGRVVRDAELEVGLVTEVWDLGLAPKPENAPMQFLLLNKATAKSESGAAPSAKEQEEMGALMGEMKKAGVLTAAEGIKPSSKAARLQFKGGVKRTVIDGPFAESKELVGGFSMLELPSQKEALAWTEKYGAILEDVEVDVLELA